MKNQIDNREERWLGELARARAFSFCLNGQKKGGRRRRMWERVVQRAPDLKREADSPTLSLSVSICRHLESPASVEKVVVLHWTRVPFFMLIIYCFFTEFTPNPNPAKVPIFPQISYQLLSLWLLLFVVVDEDLRVLQGTEEKWFDWAMMMSSRWMWDLVCVYAWGGLIFAYIAWVMGEGKDGGRNWWWILRGEYWVNEGVGERERVGGSWSFLNPWTQL